MRSRSIPTARVSVAQYLSIKHDDRGDSNETNDNGNNNSDASPNDPLTIQQTLDGKIIATLTVTDSDGDQSSNSVNIGKLITFLDDGPSVDVDRAESQHHDVTLSPLTLDKSIHQLPGDTNAASDAVAGVTGPYLITAVDSTKAIGIISTPTSANGTSVAELFEDGEPNRSLNNSGAVISTGAQDLDRPHSRR